MSSVKTVNITNFQSEVLDSTMFVLVDFCAPGCRPWNMIAPILEHIAIEMKGLVKVVKLNIAENPELAAQYIQQRLINEKFAAVVLPALVIFNGLKVVGTLEASSRSPISKNGYVER
ncbi:thioredoxin family protein [Rhizobium leguminosarum]|uniref:Thiol reductase thioredoxin n=1 Tax=Rhizobium leguminosarum TaxID=384 RepID=A0A4Q8XPC8_RHILE|nr:MULTISPECIES: thioredoxin domain-containing protein [Rhizobium]QIO70431.1 thiol reductase thioredoxin [Rhizobium leguminosarum bv. trifolii]QJX09917.1 thiol reductase thioredoxin [Rhizobium brockwellii]QIO77435.1 thiol reductase thioredoxin [Rhizobium leguminosarum bv. trifolii]QIO84454.1 thiol reductase thioredoxin [Rhizobium leguminosarum bv. trifolii]QND18218.1 thiol reductase thioredoxin [Rhizobium leguminosarum bv. trifolii]